MHSKLETELRALVCIHDQESVPATINILGALNPTKQSPLSVYMLHLVELFAKNSIKITNQNVLDKAPCSVAILVDRGLLKIPRSILESWYEYRIAVLFLGGSDDHEALAIGGRMAGHPSVHLTVIRLLDNGDARKTRLDNKVMNMFRRSMENNYRVTYKEEMVMDGLAIWDEHMELGAVGDVLASVDFMSSTTILVVQQHNNVYTENQMKHGIL
ncbi:hypothetical protein QYF36_025339 [Acer negundo]|nr:hypothetical protein QYF36_025339 [Acer negundo]